MVTNIGLLKNLLAASMWVRDLKVVLEVYINVITSGMQSSNDLDFVLRNAYHLCAMNINIFLAKDVLLT